MDKEIRASDLEPFRFPTPVGWLAETLPGAQPGTDLVVLTRPALVDPACFRAVVVPDSGCTGGLPLASCYFYGLLRAELSVLHKPHGNVNAGADADCTAEFMQTDTLSDWRNHARAALHAHQRRLAVREISQLLAEIFEGAELLPDLAPALPALAGLAARRASPIVGSKRGNDRAGPNAPAFSTAWGSAYFAARPATPALAAPPSCSQPPILTGGDQWAASA